jgi:hypothetical protein
VETRPASHSRTCRSTCAAQVIAATYKGVRQKLHVHVPCLQDTKTVHEPSLLAMPMPTCPCCWWQSLRGPGHFMQDTSVRCHSMRDGSLSMHACHVATKYSMHPRSSIFDVLLGRHMTSLARAIKPLGDHVCSTVCSTVHRSTGQGSQARRRVCCTDAGLFARD